VGDWDGVVDVVFEVFVLEGEEDFGMWAGGASGGREGLGGVAQFVGCGAF